MPSDTELLDRFHTVLLDEIRANRPDLLSSPFTIAEIYQELVPYRTHRDRIGVEMNADYEHLLIRLLAGEGDYLVLDADAAREELRSELSSPNPNTGRFREFAAADVRLHPSRLPREGEEELADGADTGDGPVRVESLAPSEPAVETEPEPGLFDGEGAAAADTEPEGPRPEEVAPERPPEGGEKAAACPWCRAALPNRENLNYCPFCGTDVHVVPCPSCGEALEPDWRFCIACGAGAASD